jgi:hypothetical protein
MVVLAGRLVTAIKNAPVPKIPVSLTTVPVPLVKLFVVLHSIPRSVTSEQLTREMVALNSAEEDVIVAEEGDPIVGIPGAIPVPEAATLTAEAPPPETEIFPE